MYLKRFVFCFLSFILLVGCEDVVTFTEPQPVDTEDMKEFPKRLRGSYMSLLDSSVLHIENNLITRVYYFDQRIHPRDMKSGTIITNDYIVDPETKEHIPAEYENDTVTVHLSLIDTLFSIDEGNVLRKFHGHYFLNAQYGESEWKVVQFDISKGVLSISEISPHQDLTVLEELRESPTDTMPLRQIKMTKKHFKKFVRQHGFGNKERFVRIGRK